MACTSDSMVSRPARSIASFGASTRHTTASLHGSGCAAATLDNDRRPAEGARRLWRDVPTSHPPAHVTCALLDASRVELEAGGSLARHQGALNCYQFNEGALIQGTLASIATACRAAARASPAARRRSARREAPPRPGSLLQIRRRPLEEPLDVGGQQRVRARGRSRSGRLRRAAASPGAAACSDAIARTCAFGAALASHITRSTSTRSVGAPHFGFVGARSRPHRTWP